MKHTDSGESCGSGKGFQEPHFEQLLASEMGVA